MRGVVKLMMNEAGREVMLSVALRVRSCIHQRINHGWVRSNSHIGSPVVRLLHLLVMLHHLTITLL